MRVEFHLLEIATMAGVTTVVIILATLLLVIAATSKVFLRSRSQDSIAAVIPNIIPDSLSSSSSSSSSLSASRSWKYDVFISFRGEDTRKTFVDSLYHALDQHGIVTYKDDVTLDRGDTIGPALLSAVRESHIALIIFSENYADSSWCLDELSYIMKCKEEDSGQIVIPIFYNVDPSDVRKQRGQFGKDFAKHKLSKNKKKVESWKKALVDASNIAGWESNHVAYGHEASNISKVESWKKALVDASNIAGWEPKHVAHEASNISKVESWKKALVDASNIAGWEPKHVVYGHEASLIQEIVDSILDILSSILDSVDDENLVGMGTRLQRLISYLRIKSGGVRMVGIWGVGGGGKTTLATSFYMKFSADFDGCCFVENIQEESRPQHGLKNLQEKILSTVLHKQMHVESVELGKHTIKQKLCHRKVLIVLDNVDHLEQLEVLAGSHNWFGDGSRILITTRDEHLLRSHRVDGIYPVSLLSYDEAIRLFGRHAYHVDNPVEDYDELCLRVISYANGLPLALKILGSFLYGKDKNEWMSALDKLKYIPNSEVTHQLKISYDGLQLEEKELFLDIACFFRRKSTYEAMEILDACGFHPAIGVKVLRQKALITITKDERFDMHDLVQEMAYYIVRGDSNNPEKHSRVWREEDIKEICSANATMENDKIEALTCNSIVNSSKSNFIIVVSNMKKLRFLKVITTTSFDEAPRFLSNELRYIYWDGFPASLFPESFQPSKLVVLKMKRSLQKELWKGYKYLPCLKEMELFYMKALVRTPEIGGLPCLQKLILLGCDSLNEIHQSLGNHSSLVYLSVIHCQKLTRFPSIVRMDKLKILRISRCKALVEFPKIEAKMDNLVELYLDEVGIQVLPSSVGEYCTNLISLKLEWCSMLKSIEGDFHALKCLENFHVNVYNLGSKIGISIPHLPRSSLTKLDFSWCKLKDGEIPSEIGELSNLQELHLRYNNFTRLDFSLLRLTLLKLLELSSCENLVELPELPSSLAILKADWCESLEVIKDDAHRRCEWLCEVSIRGERKNMTGGERLLESMFQGKAFKSGCMILQLKGLEIPRGFEPRVVRGGRCRMQLPENWYIHYSGFLFCIVVDNDNYFDFRKITTHVHEKLPGDSIRKQESQDYVYWEETVNDKYENTCMIYVSFGLLRNTLWLDQTSTAIELEIDTLDDGFRVSGCVSKLIPKTIETTITDSSFDDVSDDYTCRLKILHDSKSACKFYIDR